MRVFILDTSAGLLSPALAIPGWFLLGAALAFAARASDARRDRSATTPGTTQRGARPASPLLTGVFLGVGIIGFLDEAVFHQLLQWHTFYWNTNQHGRILSDGLFHVFSTLVLLGGTFRLWFGTLPHPRPLLAGILIGAGGFNAYDGIVQHLLLHLHLVNERVCPAPERGNSILTCRADIPFEVAWIALGLLILWAGIALWRREARA
jgi:uncharacterized membrane protein